MSGNIFVRREYHSVCSFQRLKKFCLRVDQKISNMPGDIESDATKGLIAGGLSGAGTGAAMAIVLGGPFSAILAAVCGFLGGSMFGMAGGAAVGTTKVVLRKVNCVKLQDCFRFHSLLSSSDHKLIVLLKISKVLKLVF